MIMPKRTNTSTSTSISSSISISASDDGSMNTNSIPDDCQICLGSLTVVDKEYPLLCPSSSSSLPSHLRCICNICFNCTSHLVKMGKTSSVITTNTAAASAAAILCPRCQQDVSYTIGDTFLLRKVLKMLGSSLASAIGNTNASNTNASNTNASNTNSNSKNSEKIDFDLALAQYGNIPDSELSAAELRFKHSVSVEQIEQAKNRLHQYKMDIENVHGNGNGNGGGNKNISGMGNNNDNDNDNNTTPDKSYSRRRIIAATAAAAAAAAAPDGGNTDKIRSNANIPCVTNTGPSMMTTMTTTMTNVADTQPGYYYDNNNHNSGPGNTSMNNPSGASPKLSSPSSSSSSPLSLSLSVLNKFTDLNFNTLLLDGMDDILSSAEQSFVSDLMTSGDVDKLCQACQILYELKRLQVNDNSNNNDHDNNSIKGLSGHRSNLSLNLNLMSKSNYNYNYNSNSLSDAEKRALRMTLSPGEQYQLEEMESFIELNPLPQMPKYVIFDADFDVYAKHGKVLKFRDDNWNGSISDAFSRAYSNNRSRSRSRSASDSFDTEYLGGGAGFEMEEGGGGEFVYNHYHHEEEGGFVNGSTREARQNRVLIYAARKQASKLGVKVGDIVTHFDGKEFFGGATELKEMIHDLYLEGNRSFSMMLNADQSTADILKDYAIELQKVK